MLQELFALRLKARIDARMTACQVEASFVEGVWNIRGFSAYPQTDAFVRKSAEEIFGRENVRFDLKVLCKDFPLQFAQIGVPAAGFYRTTLVRSKFDLLTQGLYASVVRVFFERDGFVLAQHPDGYVGFVPRQALQPADTACYLRWKNGPCARLRAPLKVDGMVIPPAARLVYEQGEVELVGGRRVRVARRLVSLLDPASPRFARAIQRHARCFDAAPYLWGGNTHEGTDCSGFMQSLFAQQQILLPRDANAQAALGEFVGYLPDMADLLPGDLVFFMNNDANVYHVGMYVGQRRFLHSSLTRNITCSSFEPDAEDYIARFGQSFVFARRLRLV